MRKKSEEKEDRKREMLIHGHGMAFPEENKENNKIIKYDHPNTPSRQTPVVFWSSNDKKDK
jgi:hypothetical protein